MKIGILPNIQKDEAFTYTKYLAKLLSEHAVIYMENIYRNTNINAIYTDNIYQNIDILIVLGGDGTILQAAEPCAQHNIPILGINLGRIGFMSEIETDGIEAAIKHLLNGNYITETRMMLKVQHMLNETELKSYYALNDVVISKPAGTTLVYCSIYANDEKVNSYTADGMIVATPTGSTGYSLSAGGPVADPRMELLLVTPICAHRLSARSAILPASKKIILRLDSEDNKDIIVSIDGKSRACLQYGEEIVVTKAAYAAQIIKIGKQSFYDTLVKKLS